MSLRYIAVLGLTLIGFALRLHYLANTHPFFDEYTTVLAARQILRYGWPVLPSGLFYEHGLLATYLLTPFTALYINTPLAQWQPAHWGLMLSRWPSVLIGTATIPLIYNIGCRTIQSPISNLQSPIINYQLSIISAGLFALSPEGMVWGGRARMYALATLLILLTIYFAYRGAVYPASAKYRWLALATLFATLLTQLGALMLVPALVVAMITIGWLSYKYSSRLTPHASRAWCLQPAVLLEGATLAGIIGFAIFIKRLGRPLGAAAIGSPNSGNPISELLDTVTYQTAFYFTWDETLKFLSRQFGVPHHFWLTILAISGAISGIVYWIFQHRTSKPQSPNLQSPNLQSPNLYILFLWLIFSLIIIEMVTLLEPFRRNPRYIVMYLPLFYLIAAHAIFNFRYLWQPFRLFFDYFTLLRHSPLVTPHSSPALTLSLLAVLTLISLNDLLIALRTPEPAYEQAFARIYNDWRPGDALLTMNTPAAGLYLGQIDGFTAQNDAGQFLLNAETAPVDRWLGAPWVGTAAAFNAALNHSSRAWFVVDTIRQPVYFKGDWQAVVNTQMEQVWTGDNVLVYRTRPNRTPFPTQPSNVINATLNNSIELVGYTLVPSNPQSPISNLQLTLFWQSLAPIPADYTTFLHLRNSAGVTLAQKDSQPLEGAYPTSHWQPNETIIDPMTLPLPPDLPAGHYTLFTGLYRLDTLERLPVSNDTSGENAIRLGEVTLP
jgi:hypothetical protein